jgi:hypothetical protein
MYKNQHINRENGKKLHVYIVTCGWLMSTGIALVLVRGVTNYHRVDLSCLIPNHQCFSTVEAVLYAAFARTAWGAVIGWIIFACHTGYGGA